MPRRKDNWQPAPSCALNAPPTNQLQELLNRYGGFAPVRAALEAVMRSIRLRPDRESSRYLSESVSETIDSDFQPFLNECMYALLLRIYIDPALTPVSPHVIVDSLTDHGFTYKAGGFSSKDLRALVERRLIEALYRPIVQGGSEKSKWTRDTHLWLLANYTAISAVVKTARKEARAIVARLKSKRGTALSEERAWTVVRRKYRIPSELKDEIVKEFPTTPAGVALTWIARLLGQYDGEDHGNIGEDGLQKELGKARKIANLRPDEILIQSHDRDRLMITASKKLTPSLRFDGSLIRQRNPKDRSS
jgi:hypothetical protein